MGPFAGKYSMKNIPIPNDTEYKKKLISQIEKIVRRMRWRALFFLKEDDKYKALMDDIEFYEKEETYGFNSVPKPPPVKELELFEKEIYNIVRNIVFHENYNYEKFQKELSKDLSELKKSEKVIIAANKSR